MMITEVVYMKRYEFLKELNKWLINKSAVSAEHTMDYADFLLRKLETQEAEGDFIKKDDVAVVGRYCYSITVEPYESKSGRQENLRFCIYGYGRIHNETFDDYVLDSYDPVDYIFLCENRAALI